LIRVVPDREAGPSICRDCGAQVVWAITESGGRMPVDVNPEPGGRLELYVEVFPGGEPVEPGVHRVRTRPDERPIGSPTWWSHFATCSARRQPPRVPERLLEQLRAALVRRWGPLFGRMKGRA